MFFPYRIEPDDMENDSRRVPIVTYILVGINVALFCLCQLVPASSLLRIFNTYGFVPEEHSGLTILTYMFLHANWLHIIGNMYFLWLFGCALEKSIGSVKFLALYIVSGVVAILVHSAFVPPELADVPCLGASGAISGILGGFLAVLPGVHIDSVLMLGLRPTAVVKPRAVFVLLVWLILQLFEQWVAQGKNASQVAYGAHIGGFLFGWALSGTVLTIRKAAADWQGLTRDAGLRSMAARINAGEITAEPATLDLDAQKMLFLRKGAIPEDPASLSQWVAALHPDDDAAIAASVVFRAHMEGHGQILDAQATAKGTDAIARLGHWSVALGCLLDTLETSEDESAQHLMCGIGAILWKDMGEQDKARKCLERAISIQPGSEAADRARRILEHMAAPAPA